jgi:hypothetical protein
VSTNFNLAHRTRKKEAPCAIPSIAASLFTELTRTPKGAKSTDAHRVTW